MLMELMFIGADHEVTGSCHYLRVDKKNILGKLNLILIKEIGESIVYPININDFKLNLG